MKRLRPGMMIREEFHDSSFLIGVVLTPISHGTFSIHVVGRHSAKRRHPGKGARAQLILSRSTPNTNFETKITRIA